MSNDAVAPCPFCGEAGHLTVRGKAAGIQCRSKTHLVWAYGTTAFEATENWNTRTGSQSLSEWRDISTAPKDGTQILIQHNDHREAPFIGHWGHVGRYTSSPEMWIGHPYGAMSDGDVTHWMPLPDGPGEVNP